MTTQGRRVPESAISYVLIAGLAVSMVSEVAGILLYYQQSHGFSFDYSLQWRMAGPNFFAYTADLLYALPSWQSATLMAFGIVLLMLTSYFRVLSTLVYFAFASDLRYALITVLVFFMLTLTLLLH